MTLTISLPPDAAKKLRERAKELGIDVQACAAELLQSSLRPRRSLEDISAELGKRFADSGISEEELEEDLDRAKHEMRAERRARRGA
jgi:hypothetical protein